MDSLPMSMRKTSTPVYPASLTKIMTALITLENANFSDKVTFTEDMVEK